MSRRAVLLVALGLQLLVLAGLVARTERTLASGARVVLDIAAFDPMHVFKGRYLRTPVSVAVIPRVEAPRLSDVRKGEVVFVRLEPRETHEGAEYWTRTDVRRQPRDDGAVWLRGRISRVHPEELRVDFGLDEYFINQESEDPTVRRGPREQMQMWLVVRVPGSGQGVIEDLMIGDETFDEWLVRPAAR